MIKTINSKENTYNPYSKIILNALLVGLITFCTTAMAGITDGYSIPLLSAILTGLISGLIELKKSIDEMPSIKLNYALLI